MAEQRQHAFCSAQNRWIVAALWLFLYGSFALLSPPLLDGTDALHAEIAREMIVRDDPATPYANGIRVLNKAPLLYWSMAGSMRVFGVGAAQARLPLALYALSLFLLVEAFARRAFQSARAGIYAAVSLQLSFGLFLFTRILRPDAIVCLWYAAAVFCFWQMESGPQERSGNAPVLPCLGFAAACAFNVLTDGPAGLLLPVSAMLVYLLLTRGLRGTLTRISKLHPVLAAAVFLTLVAPWHLLAAEANPAEGHPAGLTHAGRLLPWFWKGWQAGLPSTGNVHGWTWRYFVIVHGLHLNQQGPGDYGSVLLLLFWGLLLVWLVPWSAFLFHALGAVPWRRMRSADALGSEERMLLLLGIAALLPLVLFSFARRQPYCVLPSLPCFTMLIARWLDREVAEAEAMTIPAPLGHAGMRIATVLLAGGTVVALLCAFLLLFTKDLAPHEDLAALLKWSPANPRLFFGHFLNGNAAAMGAFRGPLLMIGGALFGGTMLNWRLRRGYRPDLGNMALAAAALIFLTASHIALNTVAPVLSSQQLAAAITPLLRPKNLVVINDEYEAGSTLGFYLQRSDFHILHGHSGNLWSGSFFRDAPAIFETNESLRQKWLGPERIFLWTDLIKLPPLPSKAYIVAEGGGKEIVSNRAGQY